MLPTGLTYLGSACQCTSTLINKLIYRPDLPGVRVPVQVHLDQPHDGLLGHEERHGQRQQLPALGEHVRRGVQLAVRQVHHGGGRGGRGPVAQEPGMFAAQQEVLGTATAVSNPQVQRTLL